MRVICNNCFLFCVGNQNYTSEHHRDQTIKLYLAFKSHQHLFCEVSLACPSLYQHIKGLVHTQCLMFDIDPNIPINKHSGGQLHGVLLAGVCDEKRRWLCSRVDRFLAQDVPTCTPLTMCLIEYQLC